MQHPDQQSQATSRVRRHELLAADPRSASRARKVVEELLTECSLGELADTATLLVSELVTNAVLHASSPVDLRCHVEASTLCVQVGDRSPVLPGMRHYDADALTGRGLGMVELLAAAWGVEGGEHGKTVWFQLASEDADPHAVAAVPSAGHAEWDAETYQVTFLGLPLALLTTTVQYGDSVLRELLLMTMTGSSHAAPSWQASHLDLGPLLGAVADLTAAGIDTADVTIHAPAGSGAAAFERLSLIEECDRMAHDGTLLCTPALPEILACRRWLLSQYGLQEEGAPPQPWQLPNPLPPAREAATLPPDQRRRLEELTVGALVADDANRIIYLNAAAETTIGWSATDLLGQRLVTIVPPELREAHLAGFGRYLVTAEPRLIGRSVTVPVLRSNGTRTDITLELAELDLGTGRTAFLATLS